MLSATVLGYMNHGTFKQKVMYSTQEGTVSCIASTVCYSDYYANVLSRICRHCILPMA